MGQTIAEKILSEHAGHPVKPGELIIAKVDVAAVQDGTGPLTVQEFIKYYENLQRNMVQFYLMLAQEFATRDWLKHS